MQWNAQILRVLLDNFWMSVVSWKHRGLSILWMIPIIIPTEVKVKVAQSYPTLFDPMDCSLPGSSVHEIFQARILEWVAISFSRGSFQPRDQTRASTAGRFLTDWATREANRKANRKDSIVVLSVSQLIETGDLGSFLTVFPCVGLWFVPRICSIYTCWTSEWS